MSPRAAPWQQNAPPAPSSFRVGTTLGPYRLERALGSGSFGEVWEAADHGIPSAPRRVALKILSVVGVPGGVEALSREADICRALNHPNIIEILGVHRTPEAAFIVMEFVPGPTVEQAARLLAGHHLRMPRSALLETGIGIAGALDYAWSGLGRDGRPHHIAHRNLRPAEVMLTEGARSRWGASPSPSSRRIRRRPRRACCAAARPTCRRSAGAACAK